ncbi:MAG: elongation factor G [Pseudomonadota bacterium]
MRDGSDGAPRCAVLVGPYLSGKSKLFESLLANAETAPRKGNPASAIGELSVGHTRFLGEPWTVIDCPGSIEFAQEAHNALMAADIAVVVCEPVVERALTVAPILKFLDDHDIPHLVFINKMDVAATRVRDALAALQAVSARPLVLRHVPIRDGDSVSGYVDLASERAYRYQPGKPSDLIRLPDTVMAREREARATMLEALADFDDGLLEKILEDVTPSPKEIYQQIAKDVAQDLIVPVMLGAAERNHGSSGCWKALRHDAPPAAVTAARRQVAPQGETLAQVVKTFHAAHTGKLSIARIWRGTVKDGMTLGGARVSGLYHMIGSSLTKIAEAGAGDVVALGRMDEVATGAALGGKDALRWPPVLAPVYAMAIAAENRNDEVKLSGALHKLVEEDPSLSVAHDADTGQTVLRGQGEIHINAALDKLARAYNLKVTARRPEVAYKETIRKGVSQHARHKRQSGGHGQFADIQIEIQPQPRGSGFKYGDRIVGGSVPKQYIPAVGEGVKEFLSKGPLGYRVVDIAVTLFDGSFHSVDSSDMAFKTAARIAMQEGMPKCEPYVIEPIFKVTISVPTDFTSKVQRLVTGRRGQLLGFDAKPGWTGWDDVVALMPEAEIHDLIIELRSITLGVGTYSRAFDHLAELRGRHPERASGAETAAAS